MQVLAYSEIPLSVHLGLGEVPGCIQPGLGRASKRFIACPVACFAVVQGLRKESTSPSEPFTDGFMVSIPSRNYRTPASASAC